MHIFFYVSVNKSGTELCVIQQNPKAEKNGKHTVFKNVPRL